MGKRLLCGNSWASIRGQDPKVSCPRISGIFGSCPRDSGSCPQFPDFWSRISGISGHDPEIRRQDPEIRGQGPQIRKFAGKRLLDLAHDFSAFFDLAKSWSEP